MRDIWNQHLFRLVFRAFGPALLLSGCVPATYQSVPVPSGSNQNKQAAADPNDKNSGSPAPSQTADAGNKPVAGTAAPVVSPGAGQPAPVDTGTTFGPNVPERDALEKCMNLWGTIPFKEVKAKHVKVMSENVSIGGGLFGSVVEGLANLPSLNFGNTKDLEATSEPRLIVIPLSLSFGGTTNYELMNPNGWYCLKFAAGVKSSVTIKHHCKAKIAQSDLGLSINTNPMGTSSDATKPPVSVSINDGRTPGTQMGIMVDSNVQLTAVSCP